MLNIICGHRKPFVSECLLAISGTAARLTATDFPVCLLEVSCGCYTVK